MYAFKDSFLWIEEIGLESPIWPTASPSGGLDRKNKEEWEKWPRAPSLADIRTLCSTVLTDQYLVNTTYP